MNGPVDVATGLVNVIPSPAHIADQVKRDNAVKTLTRAAALCTQLGGALDALKISLSRNDDELAEVRLQSVEILHRRLVDQFEGPAFAAALAFNSSPAADPPGEDPAGGAGSGVVGVPTSTTPTPGYDETGVSAS